MTDYDETLDDDQDSPVIAELRKKTREQEKTLKEQAERLEAAERTERRLAFFEAGIKESPKTSYFLKGYDGELTTEAIQAAAREAEILPPAEPEVPSDELATHQQMAAASAGANGSKVDWNARLAEASNPDEVMDILQQAGVPTTRDAQ